jgi:hypothetical protein
LAGRGGQAAEAEAALARRPLEGYGLSTAQSELLRLHLRVAMRKGMLYLAVRTRSSSVMRPELDALYTHRVLAMSSPPYIDSALALIPHKRKQLALSDAWCAREETLRRVRYARLVLESAAAHAMAVADAHSISRAEAGGSVGGSTRPQSAGGASIGGGSLLSELGSHVEDARPPVDGLSAMVRSAVAHAQNVETDAAKAEGRARDT